MNFFGKNLKFLISRLSISQASIESVVDKRQTTISNWINGKTDPDATDLVKLSEFFGIAIDDLCLTDLSVSNLIDEEYIANFRAKGSLKGKGIGSPKLKFHQNIGDLIHQESGIPEDTQALLWAVFKLMQGIDAKLDQLRADMKKDSQKNG
jgi:transcriptional regulator with XRE-family HTH domain